jgi:methyl-accepting chemotaxis protein
MATQQALLKFPSFQNLKIWQRLAIGFSLILAVLLIQTAVTRLLEARIQTHVEEIYTDNIKTATLLETMSEQSHIVSRRLRTVLLLRGAEGTDAQLQGIAQARAEYNKAWEELNKTPASAEGKLLRTKIEKAAQVARAENNKVLELAANAKYDAGFQQVLAARDEVEAWQAALDEYVQLQHKQNDESFGVIKEDFEFMGTMTLVFGTLAAFFATLLAYYNSRSITRPVHELQTMVEQVKAGNFEALAEIARRDEMGDLGRTVNGLLQERIAAQKKAESENDKLNDSLIDIMRSVAKISQGDLRIHAPVREDVTGALADAINSMTDATAKAMAGVNASSEAVRAESKIGRETVLSTAKGMNEVRGTIQETGKRIKRLGERSQEITGIVKLIDDIAERTSVLALNANMQAAVAGEAGRGFRVVADEVQRLAERSKEATDQIAKLVSAIQGETNDTMATMEKAIGEVVKGGEMAEKAAAQVTGLEKLGNDLHQAVQAFTLPEDVQNAARRAA